MNDNLKMIIGLLNGLNMGELRLLREVLWDMQYGLEMAEKDKIKELLKDNHELKGLSDEKEI